MSGKKREKNETNRRPKTPAAGSDGEGFFRPFSNLPKPAPAKPAEGKPSPSAQASKPVPRTAPAPKPAPKTAPKTAKRPERETTEDDLLTFDRLMGGVVPLDQGASRRVPTTGVPQRGDRDKEILRTRELERELEEQARARFRSLVDEGSRFEIVDDSRHIDGRRRGVDGGLVRRMKSGEVPVDSTLDLQGMRPDAARDAVDSFVRDRRTRGDRVLLIVHGRAKSSATGQSVLRGEVAAWLSEGKCSTHVAAFATAPDEHGGEGAMCVLLVGSDDRPPRR